MENRTRTAVDASKEVRTGIGALNDRIDKGEEKAGAATKETFTKVITKRSNESSSEGSEATRP